MQRPVFLTFCLFIFSALSQTCLMAWELAPVQIIVTLNTEQRAFWHSFAVTLKEEGYKKAVHFYRFVSNSPTLSCRAILVKHENQIYLAVPSSFVSLSASWSLHIPNSTQKEVYDSSSFSLYKKNSLFWIFRTRFSADTLQNVLFLSVPHRYKKDLFLGNLNVLFPTQEVEFFSSNKIAKRYDLQGSIILNKNLQPAGVLSYFQSRVNVLPMDSFVSILQDSHDITQTPTGMDLIKASQNFASCMNEEYALTAKNDIGLELCYQYGQASFLLLCIKNELGNQVELENSLQQGGIDPLQTALLLFFKGTIKEGALLKWRIVVSVSDHPEVHNSIVTFSLGEQIVFTSWRYQNSQWCLQQLPPDIENQLFPFLTKNKKLLRAPIKPFSGFGFAPGVQFYPNIFLTPLAFFYNLNVSRFLSFDFLISIERIAYHHAYQLATINYHDHMIADFFNFKIGARLQYPIFLGTKNYLMPHGGIFAGSANLLSKTGYNDSIFNELLIKRMPITLLIGWQAGLEWGFNVRIPMALGINIMYQQDFFGQQTMQRAPANAQNIKGSASGYFFSLYGKIAFPIRRSVY